MNNYINYYAWWKALKEWINSKCTYDNDTITYLDIMEEISKLEGEEY